MIVEAGASSTETQHFYEVPTFTTHVLHRLRQVASGIIADVNRRLANTSVILQEMHENDKLEAVCIEGYVNDIVFKVIRLYMNPTWTE